MSENEKVFLEEANIARKGCMILAENIYKYLGGLITKEDLKVCVDSILSKDYVTRFYHTYVLKDTYANLTADIDLTDLEDVTFIDDTDTFMLKEGE